MSRLCSLPTLPHACKQTIIDPPPQTTKTLQGASACPQSSEWVALLRQLQCFACKHARARTRQQAGGAPVPSLLPRFPPQLCPSPLPLTPNAPALAPARPPSQHLHPTSPPLPSSSPPTQSYAQSGVAALYSRLARNGYHFVYLTARAIGQADGTRNYLQRLRQLPFEGVTAARLPALPLP